jgi:hypothetical protein
MFNGYGVASKYYEDFASRYTSWGYALIQYDRAEVVPPIDVELQYFQLILDWVHQANNSSPFLGSFSDNIGIIGMPMPMSGMIRALHRMFSIECSGTICHQHFASHCQVIQWAGV